MYVIDTIVRGTRIKTKSRFINQRKEKALMSKFVIRKRKL